MSPPSPPSPSLPAQALRTSASDSALSTRPPSKLQVQKPQEDAYKLAREGTIRIFTRRADEREVLKTRMVREERFAFDRMVAHYTTRSKTWARKLSGNPLAADQVALDDKAYRQAQARGAAEQRQRDVENAQLKKIRHGMLQRAAAEGKDEFEYLRMERKKLLEVEKVLKAQRGQEKLEERVANMGAPRRCVKHLCEPRQKKVVRVEETEIKDWEKVNDLFMANEIMERADKGSKNGLISVGELMSYLTTSKRYKIFADWLMADGKKNFRQFDQDKSGDMSMSELHEAVRLFVGEKQELERQKKQEAQTEETAAEEEDAAAMGEGEDDGALEGMEEGAAADDAMEDEGV